jgi:hypothetical protein
MSLSEGQLRLGRLFESEFERQAHNRGYLVVRHCDQLGVTGIKAPMVTGPFCGYRLPDFTVIANGRSYWDEVKYKTNATRHRCTGVVEHGIDLPNWRDYLAVAEKSGLDGFLTIGDAHTGSVLKASFKFLEPRARYYHGDAWFKKGAVFWPVSIFTEWGSFDLKTGQMRFHFSDSLP